MYLLPYTKAIIAQHFPPSGGHERHAKIENAAFKLSHASKGVCVAEMKAYGKRE